VKTPIQIAFLGAGDVADRHADAIAAIPEARLVGIWNRTASRAEEKAARFGCSVYDSAEAACHDPSVDAVFVLTDLDTHYDFAMMALRAGKHVLVEKPVAPETSQILALRDMALQSGLCCMPGHNYIYERGLIRTREMIRNGRLGTLVSVHILYNIAHAEKIAARYPGVIQQIMTHHAYMLLFLAGKPERLSAMKATLNYHALKRENLAMVNLQMPCGALAHFTASFAADDHSGDAWTMVVKVIGTAGATHYTHRASVEYQPLAAHSQTYSAYPESIYQEVNHFVNRCLLRNEPALSNLEDAATAHEMVSAIELAATSGETILIK
jgi:predicted dehydrogenase